MDFENIEIGVYLDLSIIRPKFALVVRMGQPGKDLFNRTIDPHFFAKFQHGQAPEFEMKFTLTNIKQADRKVSVRVQHLLLLSPSARDDRQGA